MAVWTDPDLAALEAKIKMKNTAPQDPGRNWPQTPDLPRKMAIRTLPGEPPGEGAKIKIKNRLKLNICI